MTALSTVCFFWPHKGDAHGVAHDGRSCPFSSVGQFQAFAPVPFQVHRRSLKCLAAEPDDVFSCFLLLRGITDPVDAETLKESHAGRQLLPDSVAPFLRVGWPLSRPKRWRQAKTQQHGAATAVHGLAALLTHGFGECIGRATVLAHLAREAGLEAILSGPLHWVARLDVRQARWGYVLVVTLAYTWLLAAVAMGMLPLFALAALLALPLSIKAARQLLRHAAEPKQLGDAIKLTIAAMMAHGALLSLALILG